MIISIDGGTTNTRIALTDGKNILYTVKKNIGAKNTAISKTNKPLLDAVSSGINEVLRSTNTCKDKIDAIVLSGMIGSDMGLLNVPHVSAPAGIEELRKGIKKQTFSEIPGIPFTFIPGVKNNSSDYSMENINHIDIMRGEETELFGIFELENITKPSTVILPGSHNKIIFTNSDLKITGCFTTLSGEMVQSIAENTILSTQLSGKFTKEIDADYLEYGFNSVEKYGLSSTLFKIRIMGGFIGSSPKEMYSFLIGAVIHDDIKLITLHQKNQELIIGGSNPFRSAFYHLLKKCGLNAYALSEETVSKCTAVGAYKIFNS